MSIAIEEIALLVVHDAISDMNEMRSEDMKISNSLDTRLFGSTGILDSLGLVNLSAIIEEKCENRFGLAISILENLNLSEAVKPFETIHSLVSFITTLLRHSSKE